MEKGEGRGGEGRAIAGERNVVGEGEMTSCGVGRREAGKGER